MTRYRRESLEAAIWRITGRALTSGQVDAILAEAERYATTVADRRAAGQLCAHAVGRERLLAAAAELSDRRLSVHYKGIAGVTACRAEWAKPPPSARIADDWQRVTCSMCKRSRGYKDQAAAA